MRTAPIAIESALALARLSTENAARWRRCCGTNRRGEPSLPAPVRIHANISSRYAGPCSTRGPGGRGHHAKAQVAATARAAAQTSIRLTARSSWPLRSRTIIAAQAGAALSRGRSHGTWSQSPSGYEARAAVTTASASPTPGVQPRRRPLPTRRLEPVVHPPQQLVDAEEAALAVGLAAEHGLVPPDHPHGPVGLGPDAERPAGDELEEHLLVGGARQAAVGERDGHLRAPALRQPAL